MPSRGFLLSKTIHSLWEVDWIMVVIGLLSGGRREERRWAKLEVERGADLEEMGPFALARWTAVE